MTSQAAGATASGAPLRVLVARAVFPQHIERVSEYFTVDYHDSDDPLSAPQLRERLADKHGALITGSERIDATLLAGASELRAIASISVGYNHVDLPACSSHRVVVTNTPDVLTETTADLGWALMMAAARRLSESERWLRAGHWRRWSLDQMLGHDVHGSTIGIFGMGRIGQAIARRAQGFSMRVIYHNRSRLAPEIENECAARYVSRRELLETADHLVLVVPYSPSVHHMIGAAELALMKRSATITNIARGGLIDEVALCDALRRGVIAAAGLDVFEGEPKILPGLLELPNVALTPHIGSASYATRDAMAHLAIDNLVAALSGQVPPCLLNPEALAF
jgi:lactate dehydrogenase-like 2-hydroxyacid dehydrogenase